MSTAITAKPLTLDQIPADYEYYGVKLSPLGEDGEDLGWVAFTHDQRRAIAALRRHIREDYGGKLLEIGVGKPERWRMFDNCGCGETCRCPVVDDDGCKEHKCEHFGLAPCTEDGDGGFIWLGEVCDPDATGTVPAIVMDADYEL